jgi:hypothetical protein
VVRRLLLPALLLAVSLAAVWGGVGGHAFLSYDDPEYVLQNPRVAAGLTLDGAVWALGSVGYASNWHPLAWLSHMLDVELFGLDPGAHHLVNALLHGVNAFLVWAVLLWLTGRAWIGWLAALLFAVHPHQAEVVAWVAERKELVAGFLALVTLLLWIGHLRRPGRAWYAAACGAFALSLAAKQSAVMLPAVMLVLDWWPLGRGGPGRVAGREGWRDSLWVGLAAEKLPLALLALGGGILALAAQGAGGALRDLGTHPLAWRLANVPVALVSYMGTFLWPSGFSFFHPAPPAWPLFLVAISLTSLVVLGAMVASFARSHPWLAAGLATFLLQILPVLGLVQVGSQWRAERYLYLPMLGLLLMLLPSLEDLALRQGLRRGIVVPLVTLLGAGYALAAGREAGYWKDSRTLCLRALEVESANWLAHDLLGNILAREGDTEGAIGHYDEAIRLQPGYARAYYNRGVALGAAGRIQPSLLDFQQAVALRPGYAEAHQNLGVVLGALGRREEARDAFRRALALRPDYQMARRNLEALERGGRGR